MGNLKRQGENVPSKEALPEVTKMSRSLRNAHPQLDLRSILTRIRAHATVNRTGERWRARNTADLQPRFAVRLLVREI